LHIANCILLIDNIFAKIDVEDVRLL
jgi:hypothetical protein